MVPIKQRRKNQVSVMIIGFLMGLHKGTYGACINTTSIGLMHYYSM